MPHVGPQLLLSKKIVFTALPQVIFPSLARRTRALALLLLTCLSWTEIAEITHHHNGSLFGTRQLQCSADRSSYASNDLQGNEGKRNGKSTRDDCLVCQLHRNLFATAMSQALHVAPATVNSPHMAAPSISRQFQLTSTVRGRAPPINL